MTIENDLLHDICKHYIH